MTGLPIVFLPVMWVFYTAPWQVGINNLFGGFIWAGFNPANFNLLLQVTPDAGRARAVALYQTGVFASAFLGPMVGGFLADNVSFQLIFILSGAGRFLALVLFFLLSFLPMRRAADSVPQWRPEDLASPATGNELCPRRAGQNHDVGTSGLF